MRATRGYRAASRIALRREGELLCVFREGVVGVDEGGKREREVREEKSSCRSVVMSRIVEAEMKFYQWGR